MKNLKEVFAQQKQNEPKAEEHVKEVGQQVEAAGIETFTITLRNTVYLAVEEASHEQAHKIVYDYWHK